MDKSQEPNKEYFSLVKSFARDMRILLVDDNKSDIEFYKLLFGKYFMVCDTAYSGREALELYESKPQGYYDLICTDIQMPDMDGIELVKNIRKLSLKQSIIVFTGVEDVQTNQNISFYYIDGLLPKPIQREKLFTLLYRVLTRISDEKDYDRYVETLEENMLSCDLATIEKIISKLQPYNDKTDIVEAIELLHYIKNGKESTQDQEEEIEADFEDDDFFSFDSEDIDDEIDTMHIEDHEKISAVEFMAQGYIEQDMIDDINDMLHEFESQTVATEALNDPYKEEFEKVIAKFITIFNSSYEFKELAYGLEKLNDKVLSKVSADMPDAQMYRMFLDSIIEDLKKFNQEVLIEQSAVDIHYLDASLFANIAQIEMMLENV